MNSENEIIINAPTITEQPPAPAPVPETPDVLVQPKPPIAFNINGTIFTLKYNLDKVSAFEQAVCPTSSLARLVATNRGILSVIALQTLFVLGLTYMNTGDAVNADVAQKIFKVVVEKQGFLNLNEKVVIKVYDDCPFLFQS